MGLLRSHIHLKLVCYCTLKLFSLHDIYHQHRATGCAEAYSHDFAQNGWQNQLRRQQNTSCTSIKPARRSMFELSRNWLNGHSRLLNWFFIRGSQRVVPVIHTVCRLTEKLQATYSVLVCVGCIVSCSSIVCRDALSHGLQDRESLIRPVTSIPVKRCQWPRTTICLYVYIDDGGNNKMCLNGDCVLLLSLGPVQPPAFIRYHCGAACVLHVLY